MAKTDTNTPAKTDTNTPVTRNPNTLDVLDSEVFQRFLAAGEATSDELSADEVTVDIIGRILNATSVDDVLGGTQATHARDFLDTPFALTGVRFNQSDFEGAGPKFYALLEGADRNGEKVTITCGARNVIAQAWKLKDMDALPVQVELRQSDRPTRAGYHVLWLEKASAPF